jgi:hypothetical protein
MRMSIQADGATDTSDKGHKGWVAEARSIVKEAIATQPANIRLRSTRKGIVDPDQQQLTGVYGLKPLMIRAESERVFILLNDTDQQNHPLPIQSVNAWWSLPISCHAAKSIFQFRACRPRWMAANQGAGVSLRGNRLCGLCLHIYNERHYDDEFHTLLNCPIVARERTSLVNATDISSIEFLPRPQRLQTTFTRLATPVTQDHAVAPARLLTRAHSLRALLFPHIRTHHTIPQPDILQTLLDTLKTDNKTLARNLPERKEIETTLQQLRSCKPWHAYLNESLKQVTNINQLSECV